MDPLWQRSVVATVMSFGALLFGSAPLLDCLDLILSKDDTVN